MRIKVAMSVAAIAVVSAAQAVPAQAATSSLACKYAVDLHSVDGELYVGKAAGTFTEFTCAQVGHDGAVRSLSLASDSGETAGMVSEVAGANGHFNYGGQADIGLVDGRGGGMSFRLYPGIILAGGSGSLSGNAKGEGGFGAYGVWGTATLTSLDESLVSCVSQSAACARQWHIQGSLTIPMWTER